MLEGFLEVAWVRAEDQTILSLHTKVVTHNNRVSVTHDDLETWKLRIRPVKESDRGCYLCQINTPVLKSQRGCLDVFEAHRSADHTKSDPPAFYPDSDSLKYIVDIIWLNARKR
ncbi:hypothetical protein NQ318_010142 [Aromia moschata]|uniref:Immunoglobulin-like beta-sandwich domain-containing protein n=1 Tax=Aromia moschata TaxID=1265417 RepID=A0AAV8XQT6_9CUCU|nr:hypothetical protein NQ318_010142 [Aromia moschata]